MDVTVDVGKNVTELLRQLAQQIGVSITDMWPWYVKQQYISGWVVLTCAVICFLLVLVGMRIVVKGVKIDAANTVATGAVLAVVFTAIGLLTMSTGAPIQQILNPEYYAAKALMQDITPFLHK